MNFWQRHFPPFNENIFANKSILGISVFAQGGIGGKVVIYSCIHACNAFAKYFILSMSVFTKGNVLQQGASTLLCTVLNYDLNWDVGFFPVMENGKETPENHFQIYRP